MNISLNKIIKNCILLILQIKLNIKHLKDIEINMEYEILYMKFKKRRSINRINLLNFIR